MQIRCELYGLVVNFFPNDSVSPYAIFAYGPLPVALSASGVGTDQASGSVPHLKDKRDLRPLQPEAVGRTLLDCEG